MKKLLSLFIICVPLCAAAQWDEIAVGIGASLCSRPNNLSYLSEGSSATIVPDVQVAYFKGGGKHYQYGLSLGATSFRRSDFVELIDIYGQPLAAAKASFRFAQIAIPLKAEGRYIIPFKSSHVFAGLSAGVIFCIGSKGPSGPYSGSNLNSIPSPVVIAYDNTTSFITGISAGYAHAIHKHVQLGIMPTVNFITGNFRLSGSSYPAVGNHFFDYQLHITGTYSL